MGKKISSLQGRSTDFCITLVKNRPFYGIELSPSAEKCKNYFCNQIPTNRLCNCEVVLTYLCLHTLYVSVRCTESIIRVYICNVSRRWCDPSLRLHWSHKKKKPKYQIIPRLTRRSQGSQLNLFGLVVLFGLPVCTYNTLLIWQRLWRGPGS